MQTAENPSRWGFIEKSGTLIIPDSSRVAKIFALIKL